MPQPTETILLLGRTPLAALRKTLPKKYRLHSQADPTRTEVTLLDTFDQDVRRSGRVLVDLGRDWLLLLADGVLLRQAAPRAGRFVADLDDGPLRTALADMPGLRALLPLGQGVCTQTDLVLLDKLDKTQAQLSLIALDGAEAGLTLARLRPLRGYDKAFNLLHGALAPRALAPDRLAPRSYAALAPDVPRYVAKPDVPMVGTDTGFDIASRIIAAYIDVARQNEAGIIDDLDTEFLHDYRVALRKVRSVLSLFKGVYSEAQTAMLKAKFSALMAPTGRLRDLDVYLLERDLYFDLLPPPLHPGLNLMFDAFAAERQQGLRRLSRRFKSKAYAKEMTDLCDMFANPTALHGGPNAGQDCANFARTLIWKRYRKFCKIARAITDVTPDAEVHELRIQGKKLRYLMEFFAPMFDPREVKSLIKALKKLQDVLGLFNDYSVQQDSLSEFVAARGAQAQQAAQARAQDMIVAQAVGALIAVLHSRQLEQRALVAERFAGFDSADTRARFAALFKERAG